MDYIRRRISIYDNILKSKENGTLDNHIGDMKDLNNDKLVSIDLARNILFRNSDIKMICDNLRETYIPIILAGSAPIGAAHVNNFIPNDYDFFVMNLNEEKMRIIEDAIISAIEDRECIVVRTRITVSYLFFDKCKSNDILKIQVSLINIDHWVSLFNIFHSDLTCFAWDVSNEKFIYFKDRFPNALTNKEQIFSNIMSVDSESSIHNASKKYRKRGFKCNTIIIESQTPATDTANTFLLSSDRNKPVIKDIIKYIQSHWKNVLVAISNSAYGLVNYNNLISSWDIPNLKFQDDHPFYYSHIFDNNNLNIGYYVIHNGYDIMYNKIRFFMTPCALFCDKCNNITTPLYDSHVSLSTLSESNKHCRICDAYILKNIVISKLRPWKNNIMDDESLSCEELENII